MWKKRTATLTNEREEEEEVDELEGGGASDAAPALKKKGKHLESHLNSY